MKNSKKKLIIGIIILVAVLLVWGLIGQSKASNIGITCDFGIKDMLCWKWHKNVVGQIGDALKNLFG